MHRRIIGRFNLASGRLIVTDPCYARSKGFHVDPGSPATKVSAFRAGR